MVSYLDYIKEVSSNPWDNSGVIFSGESINTVKNRFPKVNGITYIIPTTLEITDMTEYGLVGFWKCEGDEEQVLIDNKAYYKCDLYMPDSEEIVGYYYRQVNIISTNDKLEINNVVYSQEGNGFKYNNIYSYQTWNSFQTLSSSICGVPRTYKEILKKEENKLVVFRGV